MFVSTAWLKPITTGTMPTYSVIQCDSGADTATYAVPTAQISPANPNQDSHLLTTPVCTEVLLDQEGCYLEISNTVTNGSHPKRESSVHMVDE